MKKADASGAAYAVILGEDEIAKGVAAGKHLRDTDPEHNQHSVALDAVVDHLIDHIIGKDEHDNDHAGHIHYHP